MALQFVGMIWIVVKENEEKKKNKNIEEGIFNNENWVLKRQ